MARLTQELIDEIVKYVGRFNTDILCGWEAGLKGKERIGGKLFIRIPPNHFTGQRRNDWYAGQSGAKLYRELNERRVVFAGETKDGELTIRLKGWGVRRGKIVTRMEKLGAFGNVTVMYFEGSKIVRTVNCGI